MSLLVLNLTVFPITINDLGLEIPASSTIDLIEEEAGNVARSTDLTTEITAGNIIVLDPLDNITPLSIADSIIAIAAHNDTHFRIRGGTLDQLDDVTLVGLGPNDVIQNNGFGTFVNVSPATLGSFINLDDLGDVILTAPAASDALVFDGVNWVNIAGTTTDEKVKISATDTTPGFLFDELTVGTGLFKTIVSPGFNETLNLTLDSDLVALATTITTGLYTITGIGSSVTRTIVAGSTKITVTNGDGSLGNPSIDFGIVALNDLSDVIITVPTSGQVLRFNGTDWVNAAITSTDITDFNEAAQDAVGTILIDSTTIDFTYNDLANTITAAVIDDTNTQRVEVVKNSGAVVSTRKQLNFIEGSGITLTIADDGGSNQADITIAAPGSTTDEQVKVSAADTTPGFLFDELTVGTGLFKTIISPGANETLNLTLDSDLVALAGIVTTGLYVITGVGSSTTRTLVAPVAGITIADPSGVLGNPTFALANDLSALEGLGGTGFAVRTAADAWAQRTLVAGANITITNPAGILGDPTIALIGTIVNSITLTQPAAGLTLTNTGVTQTGAATSTFALANDLSALEGLGSTGFATRTAADTWAQRTLIAPAAGFTITNPAGIAGDPTFVLANDLGAIEALNTNGLFARTATDTFAARTITAGANITVTNGDGIAGNPTIALTGTIVNSITLTQPAAGLTLTNTGVTQTGAATSTFALANDLGAIEALNTNAILVRTGTDAWAARTIVAGSTKITVTNGSGGLGNPSIDFGTVTFDDLSDVIITTPTSGQLVRFNGTNWVNVSTNNVLRLYSENPSAETTPLVAGTNAVAIGTGSSASGTRAFARGNQSLARLQDESAFASGSFTTAGDAQVRQFVVRTQTTNATITEAFIDGTGGAVRMTLPNDTTWMFSVYASARRTDANDESAAYKVEGGIDRNATAASTALVAAVTKTVFAEDNAAWDITVDADTTNGSLRVRFTGQAAKTINWVAYVRAIEVTG